MSLNAYADWVEHTLLPFWLETARNPATGLFHEKLHLDGTPDPAAHLRTRTMFRQIYTLSHAALLGLLPRERALAEARAGLAAMVRHALSPDGRPGWVAVLKADGAVISPRRDLYDHAFVLLGLAWYHKATGEAEALRLIDTTLSAIDTVLASPHGGWAESEAQDVPRRQNPHMHLFEASMALAETMGGPRDLARAAEIFSLFRTRFFDHGRGLLTEYFSADWSALPDGNSERFEPGHMAEWVWLLRRYEALTGAPVARFTARLLERAEALGRQADGFLCDEIDATGRPLIDRRRLWPQTEYLKALIVEAVAGDTGARARADDVAARLLNAYVRDGVGGCFIDQYTLAGRPTADHVPASIVYHIFAVLPEIRRLRALG